jgi:uncharacterized protein (DUF58 family)
MMSRLSVHRVDPRHGSVGEPLIVGYRLRNRSRLCPAFDLQIDDQRAGGSATFQRLMGPAGAWAMHVGPRDAVHGEAVFWPVARGEARFDRIRVTTSFPFGLVRKSFTISQPARTLVYPRLYQLRRGVLGALTTTGPLGSRVSTHSGPGDDYYGLREYRPGDSLRHVAWKRTANRDQIVCVERSRPSPPRLRVVLNLTRPTEALRGEPGRAAARQREEDAISLAASIVYAADGAGYEVGLTVLGLPIAPIPVRRGAWHLGRIMAALAQIDLDQARAAPGHGSPDAGRVALAVIHPDRVDPALGPPGAWHLTAAQMARLTARPIGWDPEHNRALARGAGRGAAREAPGPRTPQGPRASAEKPSGEQAA